MLDMAKSGNSRGDKHNFRKKAMNDEAIAHGWHHTFGWLRRTELDTAFDGFVYEDGDGDLIISQDPRHALEAYLDCWEDAATGEKYLTFSKLPRTRRRKNAVP